MQVEIRYKALKKIHKLCFASILGLAPALFGCADAEVAKVRHLDPAVAPALNQLYLQYGAMALRKSAEGNTSAARHFSAKATRAAHGMPVAPDHPDNGVLENAYGRLTAAFEETGTTADPAVLARAQVMFDCWLDEQMQGVDLDDIVACNQEFERALLMISGADAAGRQTLQ